VRLVPTAGRQDCAIARNYLKHGRMPTQLFIVALLITGHLSAIRCKCDSKLLFNIKEEYAGIKKVFSCIFKKFNWKLKK